MAPRDGVVACCHTEEIKSGNRTPAVTVYFVSRKELMDLLELGAGLVSALVSPYLDGRSRGALRQTARWAAGLRAGAESWLLVRGDVLAARERGEPLVVPAWWAPTTTTDTARLRIDLSGVPRPGGVRGWYVVTRAMSPLMAHVPVVHVVDVVMDVFRPRPFVRDLPVTWPMLREIRHGGRVVWPREARNS